ncbi:MAG: GNAT family N-acetyltransferase [Lachnospiraceae bacterium]|nr:GNAT family N-acetyltransferase [Lachnospiraceae bacterium]
MNTDIKKIEDLSLNAWPSHQMEVYDGWILRFSYFYTHRTNCVEHIGASILPLEEKIQYCEQMYRRWNTPCIFKISPVTDPALDGCLQERGYRIEHDIYVMTAELTYASLPAEPDMPDPGLRICAMPSVNDRWIDALFALKKSDNAIHRKIVPSMYAAIPKDEIALCIENPDGEIIATGLGIMDRDYVGVYAVHVHENYRRQGLGRIIVSRLLREGYRKGASHAYLQVVSDNAAAKALYRYLGFQIAYRCWFRVK